MDVERGSSMGMYHGGGPFLGKDTLSLRSEHEKALIYYLSGMAAS